MGTGINWRELLLVGVAGWTGLGVVGLSISWVRQRRGLAAERARIVRGFRSLVAVWVVYGAVVVGVSMVQPRKVVKLGQEQCFHAMCYTVTGVEDVPRFLGKDPDGEDLAPSLGDGSRLLRVEVIVRNRNREDTESDGRMQAYLVDAQGRSWEQSKGVSGNRLSSKVAAGAVMVSQPMFRVDADATGLGLVLTRGRWQPGVLVVGDTDSVWHRRTVVDLGR